MISLRTLGVAILGIAVALLVLGFILSNDFLGFLFMVCLVVGLVALIADAFRRRARRNSSTPLSQ